MLLFDSSRAWMKWKNQNQDLPLFETLERQKQEDGVYLLKREADHIPLPPSQNCPSGQLTSQAPVTTDSSGIHSSWKECEPNQPLNRPDDGP